MCNPCRRRRNLIKFHSFLLWCQSIFFADFVSFLGRKKVFWFVIYYFNFFNQLPSNQFSCVLCVTRFHPFFKLESFLLLCAIVILNATQNRTCIQITISLFIYAISFSRTVSCLRKKILISLKFHCRIKISMKKVARNIFVKSKTYQALFSWLLCNTKIVIVVRFHAFFHFNWTLSLLSSLEKVQLQIGIGILNKLKCVLKNWNLIKLIWGPSFKCLRWQFGFSWDFRELTKICDVNRC